MNSVEIGDTVDALNGGTGVTLGRRRRWRAFLVGLVGCALLSVPGSASAAQRVIVKPKPGQEITRHPVRLVVRAGPEDADLKARLNGVRIGKHFLVRRRGIRELDISNSHGLRHGRNVLEVRAQARNGARVRRSTVEFTVGHERPLAGAGRDRTVVRRTRVELNGRVTEHPEGPGADRLRWKLVDAPRGSRLSPGSSSKLGSDGPPALRQASSLSPAFTPDVNGTYRFKMAVGSGIDNVGDTRDFVDIHAILANPGVEVHTRVTDDPSGRPAIEVGPNTYIAPFLARVGGTGIYSNQAERYWSLFQVLILNRHTLELVDNRTYGVCLNVNTGDIYTCRKVDGRPQRADLREELRVETPESLVIVNSLPAAEPACQPGPECASPEDGPQTAYVPKYALEALDEIGFPNRNALEEVRPSGPPSIEDQLKAAPPDSLSVIGVPDLKPGGADFAVIPEAGYEPNRGMNGFLVPNTDKVPHYGFLSSGRVPFDTRAAATSCNDTTGCTMTATVGEDETKQTLTTPTINAAYGGYLVATYDPHTLDRRTLDFFTVFTSGGHVDDSKQQVINMAATLKAAAEDDSLILISSMHTPFMQGPFLYEVDPDTWEALAKEVAAVGGTLHNFNLSAVTSNSDYSLVGWGGAGEGGGSEAIGKDASIRGVLVRDGESKYKPANVVDEEAADPPSEILTKIVMQPPGKNWELKLTDDLKASGAPWWPAGTSDDSAGTRAAIAFVGGQVAALGSDPRTAYWFNSNQITTDTPGNVAAATLTDPDTGETCSCTQDELDKAKAQLQLELRRVATVRNYLANLAYPAKDAGANAWSDTQSISDELTESRRFLDEEAKQVVEAIEGTFGLVASFLDLGEVPAVVAGYKNLEKAIKATGAGLELAAEFTRDYDGDATVDGPTELRADADQVADELQAQAQAVSKSFKTMGDMIVSDWGKLRVIGKWGGCIPPPETKGCPKGLEELAFTDPMKENAVDAAKLAQRRTVYQHLLPYSFPVLDTGLTWSCPLELYAAGTKCSPDGGPVPNTQGPGGSACGDGSPYVWADSPNDSYLVSLERLDPGRNVWRPYLSAGRSNLTWGFADPSIYKRMFGDASGDTEALEGSPLGIDKVEFFIHSHERMPFALKGTCIWNNQPK